MEQNSDNRISKYTAEMSKYFKENDVHIVVVPSEFLREREIKVRDKKIASPYSYIQFIESELEFWDDNNPDRTLQDISKVRKLEQAKESFYKAYDYYLQDNSFQGNMHLNNSVNFLSGGVLYSKTDLAKYVLSYGNRSTTFISGLKDGISTTRTNSKSVSVDYLEGVFTAFAYLKIVDNPSKFSKKELLTFSDAVNKAIDNYNELDSEYIRSFHEQELRILDREESVRQDIENLENNAKEYFDNRNIRCEELETLYREKLMLQGPAEYWSAMEEDYTKKGKRWLWASVVCSVVVIGILLLIIWLVPNLFSDGTHWIDVFKNSAIITVIASIAIYTLRVMVKMSMSSYHLARDAKEREQLAYFYLALKDNDGVTDKERAIVLNALFSRSETGLLKGDSSPTMSGDVLKILKDQ